MDGENILTIDQLVAVFLHTACRDAVSNSF